MLGIRFSQSLAFGSMLLLAGVFAAQAQSSGPKIYPAAMSMDYNPLRWQGEDAQFGLDMLRSSYCTAEASKAVAVKTQNPRVQTVALTMAHEQHKIYRQLHNMARTFNVPLPRRRDLENCPAASRIAELSGHEMDQDYISLLLSTTATNVLRFEEELTRPRDPSNWSLWNLAKKDLPMMQSEQAAAKDVQQAIPSQK